MRPEFNFGNAVTHFLHTGGPRGFILKFVLIYAVLGVLLQGISAWLQWPVYEIYLRVFADGGDIYPYMDEINRASMQSNLIAVLLMPFSLLLWIVFEGASQRRYMRSEPFRLAIGADEGRLAIVALIWIALMIGAYIGLFIILAIFIGIGALAFGGWGGAILAIVGVIAGFCVMLWFFARLSPAAAMTIRDRQIRFFEAWRVTRGKGGVLFTTYLVLLLGMMVVTLVGYAAIFGAGFLAMMPAIREGRSDDLSALATNPLFLISAGAVSLALFGLYALFVHVFGGPAALAAKTDPEWNGEGAGTVDTFS